MTNTIVSKSHRNIIIKHKKRGTVCHTVDEGRRKTREYKYEITAHAKCAEPLCNSCILMKISYIFIYKLSITLLFMKSRLANQSGAKITIISFHTNIFIIKSKNLQITEKFCSKLPDFDFFCNFALYE